MASYAYPLKRASGKRYLVDQNGAPYLMSGEAPWVLLQVLSSTDITSYLDGAVKRNVQNMLIQVADNQYTYSYVHAGLSGLWGANINGDFPFLKDQSGVTYNNGQTQSPDFSTSNINPSYWNYMDTLMTICSGYPINFCVYVQPWVGNPLPGYPSPNEEGYYGAQNNQSSAIRQAWGAWVANRYKWMKNLIWVVGGDNNPPNSAVVSDVATGVLSADTSHLITADCLDGSSPLTVTEGWSPPSTFVASNVNNIYTNITHGWPYTYKNAKTEWQRTDYPNVPYFQKEGYYPDLTGSPPYNFQLARAQSYQTMLGGGIGYHWGSFPTWYLGSGYQAGFDSSQISIDHQILTRFLLGRRWELLIPDWGNLFLTNGASYTNASFVSAASASDGSWGAIYTQSNVSLTVNLAMFSANVTVYWMDPCNGARTNLGTFSPSGSHTFASTPGNNSTGDADWVLVFETQLPTTSWFS